MQRDYYFVKPRRGDLLWIYIYQDRVRRNWFLQGGQRCMRRSGCTSNYSFLEGASDPGELVEQAHLLGLTGLAENLFAIIKVEELRDFRFNIRAKARDNCWRNAHRRHLTLGELFPATFEAQTRNANCAA